MENFAIYETNINKNYLKKKTANIFGSFFAFLFMKLVFFCRIKWEREKKYLIFVMQ